MVLKICMDDGSVNGHWHVRDKIEKVSWMFRPLGFLGKGNYDFVSMSNDPLATGEERYYKELCATFENGTEMLFAFSSGYLLNDDGKTIERL